MKFLLSILLIVAFTNTKAQDSTLTCLDYPSLFFIDSPYIKIVCNPNNHTYTIRYKQRGYEEYIHINYRVTGSCFLKEIQFYPGTGGEKIFNTREEAVLLLRQIYEDVRRQQKLMKEDRLKHIWKDCN